FWVARKLGLRLVEIRTKASRNQAEEESIFAQPSVLAVFPNPRLLAAPCSIQLFLLFSHL
ncbi:hypothetical protein, partial [Candidatus Cyanaurora vandensis]|uniref:hypothetical protein n=1 Tax=Candidatus Cyanaurora vandensis TaxID=2714958 RepID=UPI00257B47F2